MHRQTSAFEKKKQFQVKFEARRQNSDIQQNKRWPFESLFLNDGPA